MNYIAVDLDDTILNSIFLCSLLSDELQSIAKDKYFFKEHVNYKQLIIMLSSVSTFIDCILDFEESE